MRILILNGSPRPKGNTKQMVDAFRSGAESAGHRVDVIDVCRKKIAGCLACEYCHTRGNGACVQKDDMQEVYSLLGEAPLIFCCLSDKTPESEKGGYDIKLRRPCNV